MQLYTILQNQFSTQSSDLQKLFSDLVSLANISWNQEPYNTIFAPLLRAIQTLQNNKSHYRKKRPLLSYNLYLGLPPDKRDNEFLSSLPAIALPKLSKPEIYSPPNHWIYESEEIRALWQDHVLHGKQPDSRLRRDPLLKLEENQLQLDIAGSQSSLIQDEATGEIVANVFRPVMGHPPVMGHIFDFRHTARK